jgi:hypothetical protein
MSFNDQESQIMHPTDWSREFDRVVTEIRTIAASLAGYTSFDTYDPISRIRCGPYTIAEVSINVVQGEATRHLQAEGKIVANFYISKAMEVQTAK